MSYHAQPVITNCQFRSENLQFCNWAADLTYHWVLLGTQGALLAVSDTCLATPDHIPQGFKDRVHNHQSDFRVIFLFRNNPYGTLE